jgi:hypothetical protein
VDCEVALQEAYLNVRKVEWYKGEYRTRGRRGNIVFETHERTVAARKWRTRVACARRYGAMYCPGPTTATKGSLQYEPRARGVPEVPRFANLCIERKIRLFVGDVANKDVGNKRGEE